MRCTILMAGLASVAVASGASAQPIDKVPATATTTATGGISPPPEGKGQVVFYRPSRMKGMAISYSVREGDTTLGKLGNGSYFALPVEPGLHSYRIQSELKDTLRLEVDPGETYYVMQSMDIGIALIRAYLTPSDAEAFARERKLKPVKAAE
jgi:hypothetical protein